MPVFCFILLSVKISSNTKGWVFINNGELNREETCVKTLKNGLLSTTRLSRRKLDYVLASKNK